MLENDLLRVLELRFGPLPEEIIENIRFSPDSAPIREWFEAAVTAPSLTDFRETTAL
jgi:hypothetical protein